MSKYNAEICARLAAEAKAFGDFSCGPGCTGRRDECPTRIAGDWAVDNLAAMADQLDAARALIDDLKGVDATEALLQLRELGRLLSERDAARAEATRYRSLAEHYELCAKAYQRMKELDAICEAHPALADPVGQAAEVELMELCGKLQEYAMYIRTHTEGTP